MPYIKGDRRADLWHPGTIPVDAGELNFLLTRAVLRYVEVHGLGYGTLNDVVGALECAKIELYRRVVALYEDAKCAENGDVYGGFAP